jgi:hypothetical protein
VSEPSNAPSDREETKRSDPIPMNVATIIDEINQVNVPVFS